MGFADALGSVDRPIVKGPKCSILRILDRMGTTDAEALQSALDDDTVSHAVITRALRNEGHWVGSGTIARHRRNECQCWKFDA